MARKASAPLPHWMHHDVHATALSRGVSCAASRVQYCVVAGDAAPTHWRKDDVHYAFNAKTSGSTYCTDVRPASRGCVRFCSLDQKG